MPLPESVRGWRMSPRHPPVSAPELNRKKKNLNPSYLSDLYQTRLQLGSLLSPIIEIFSCLPVVLASNGKIQGMTE